MNNVIKRDGREVPFDASKIRIAITKAYYDLPKEKQEQSTSHPDELIRVWTDTVVDRCAAVPHALNVEDIQDIVENTLMGYGATETARSYIRYRYKREMARHGSDDFFATLKPKIQATDVQNQNANVDEYSFGGRTGEATNEMMKQYALRYCMSDMARKNHLNNEIYTHDLSSYAVGCHNCLSIPFDDLLANGFAVRQTDIRPAGSINTAFQLVAVIMQIQSLQQFGGVAATHLDWTMVPYVRKSFFKHYVDGMRYIGRLNEDEINANLKGDYRFNPKDKSITDEVYKQHKEEYAYAMDMTKRELKQAVEGMFHNLNCLGD